jgi:HSP20 family protein
MLSLWNQFDDLFSDNALRSRGLAPRSFVPAVDISETKEGYELVADVPGIAPEKIEVTVEEGVLKLRGERKDEREDKKDGYRRVERTFGSFERSFVLPKGVNSDQVSAGVEHGQLRVRIPKPAQLSPRKVEVKKVLTQ